MDSAKPKESSTKQTDSAKPMESSAKPMDSATCNKAIGRLKDHVNQVENQIEEEEKEETLLASEIEMLQREIEEVSEKIQVENTT